MPKLILVITSILMFVSIVLGFMNRGKFIELREKKDADNTSTRALVAEAEEVISGIEDFRTTIASAEDARDIANEEISSTERRINAAIAKHAAAEQGIKERDLKIAEIEEALKDWDGVTPETLNEKIEEMEKQIADTEMEISNIESEVEVFQGKVAQNQESLAGYESQQSRRAQDIALNSTEGTVTAVNNDWGFVVVNAGSNKGVEEDDLLIVRRGGVKVGQLDIISIEPNSLVANIVPGTATAGAIQPGDQVVFVAGGATASN
ncbi:hypothetical protein BH23VER1_BH23VER1_31340 [soil metagenome]